MEDVITTSKVASANDSAQVAHAQMPLSFLRVGESARVAKVRDKGDLHHHLENLGFVENAAVKVVCENGGNLIVEVKGTQVALNKQVAAKIITK